MHTSILKLVYVYWPTYLANQVAIFVFYLPEDGQMINQNT
jgi:hypothetical protein